MMRYVYIYNGMILTFGHKNMPNFRLSANSISEQMQKGTIRLSVSKFKGTQSLKTFIYIKQLLPLQRKDR